MKIDFRDKEQLRQQLISIGLGEKVLQHKAFDVVLDQIQSHLMKGSISKVEINNEDFSIDKTDNSITFKHHGKDLASPSLLTGVLMVDAHSISLSISEYPEDSQEYQKLENERRTYTVEITREGNLEFKSIEGLTILKPNEKKQYESASVEKRTFSTSGIEFAKEIHHAASTRDNSGTLHEITSITYEDIATNLPRGKHFTFRRDGTDIAWVSYKNYENHEENYGYTELSNEYGLQEMRVMPGPNNNYIWDDIHSLTEEEYEEKIVKGNSPEIQEVLRQTYNKQSRLNLEAKKR